MRKTALVGVAVAGLAMTGLGAPGASAAPAAAPTAKKVASAPADVSAKKTDHVKCGKGKGGNKRVNFSWKKGTSSTTIYFNNHCKKGKRIPATVWARQGSPGHYTYARKCLTTKGGTDGKKKFSTGRYSVWNIKKDKHCK